MGVKNTIYDVLSRALPVCVTDGEECWLWPGTVDVQGYGRVNLEGRYRLVHKTVWEYYFGPVPQGLELDHLCRQRHYGNPGHLEAVTRKENILRGAGLTAVQSRQTHCLRGHEFTPENTYRRASVNRRECRACWPERKRRARERAIEIARQDQP